MALTDADRLQMTGIVLMRHNVLRPDILNNTNYIKITNPADLNNIRNNLSGKYILMNDIDLSGWGNWNPIVNFKGVLEGNGYAILNMHVDTSADPRHAGLFGSLANHAIIRNLGIKNAYVKNGYTGLSSRDYKGILVGVAYNATVINCFVQGHVVISTDRAAGMAGYASDSTFIACYSVVTFDGSSSTNTGSFYGQTERKLSCLGCCYDKTVGNVGIGSHSGEVPLPYPTGLTTTQMKALNTNVWDYYTWWDFVHTWAIDPTINDGYPYLRAGLLI